MKKLLYPLLLVLASILANTAAAQSTVVANFESIKGLSIFDPEGKLIDYDHWLPMVSDGGGYEISLLRAFDGTTIGLLRKKKIVLAKTTSSNVSPASVFKTEGEKYLGIKLSDLKEIKMNNGIYQERYYVLKSNRKIKHGYYFQVMHLNKDTIEGFFINNKMQGPWRKKSIYGFSLNANYLNGKRHGIWERTSISSLGKVLIDSGAYSNGRQTGLWSYIGDSLRNWKCDFTSKQVYRFPTAEDKVYHIVKGTDTLDVLVDSPPIIGNGGPLLFAKELADSADIPEDRVDKWPTSRLPLIEFYIDSAGTAGHFKIVRSSGDNYIDTALREGFDKIQLLCIPAFYGKKPVTTRVILPVTLLHEPMEKTRDRQMKQIRKEAIKTIQVSPGENVRVDSVQKIEPQVKIVF